MLIRMTHRIFQLLALVLLLITQPVIAAADKALLHPDEAFLITATSQNVGEIQVQWEIAEGYYLYKDKFQFTLEAPVTLGQVSLPKGKIKQDEFFGEIATYRGRDSALLAVTGAGPTTLKVSYQGCADQGVCYPPQRKTFTLDIPAPKPVVSKPSLLDNLTGSSGGNLFDSLGGIGGSDAPLLEADQAFAFSATLKQPGIVAADWMIAEGYYLYKDKIKLALETASGLSLGEPTYPASITKEDPTFGSVETYRGLLQLDFPILNAASAPQSLNLVAKFQGCADIGICYPPMEKQIDFEPSSLASFIIPAAQASTAVAPAPIKVSEQDQIAASLAGGNTLLTLLTFLGFGLLLAFTPCVFPMIPILSGIIIGHGRKISTRRAFSLSVAYVLAMALTYTVVGVLAGLFGANLQVWFQNPWVLSGFAVIFVLLSLSMFGFYDLQMPSFIQSKLSDVSHHQKSGSLVSAAIMGFLSALIVGPCVTAPLVGALIYIGQTGDAVLGGLALFALSMGMGAPLLLIGASAGKLLPKAGMWMDAIKAVFGVLLLAVAIWLLERVLPTSIVMTLSGVLLIVSGIYMGALQQISEGHSQWRYLWKGLGFVGLIYGALLLIGAAANTNNILQPLRGMAGSAALAGTSSSASKTQFQAVKGLVGLEQALTNAKANQQTVVLDFYADWCISCKEMEAFTFSDASVQQALANSLLLKADVTANDNQDKALLKKFGIIGPPAILFFNVQGEEQRGYRVVGFQPAKDFAPHSRAALK